MCVHQTSLRCVWCVRARPTNPPKGTSGTHDKPYCRSLRRCASSISSNPCACVSA
ncbi:hypothetical protein T484DRAFT_1930370 [Baffinella frigidus]|nr:hypothetical protein T484DRAFT_1930370 [Cryptophyta sp. CCMP2293]